MTSPRSSVAAAIAVAAVVAATAALLVLATTVSPHHPRPQRAPAVRRLGEGPGLVGDPAFALVGVLAVVVLAIVVSLVYVRLTGGPRGAADGPTGRR